MNLKELRQHLRIVLGRYDLVGEGGQDLGINPHINNASRFLDRRATTNKSLGQKFYLTTIGNPIIPLTQVRSIHEVWAGDVSKQWELTALDLHSMLTNYAEGVKNVAAGTPAYWTGVNLRAIPDVHTQDELTALDWVTKYMDVLPGPTVTHYDYNGVILMPRPSAQFMVRVIGHFYSNSMIADTDTNFWASQHPDLLTMAVAYQLEVLKRNTQGANDWANAINLQLTDLECDLIENEAAQISEMRG